ncbi:MAG: S-layer homology domain-containing protein [Clostridia bacterium]|nr:S-layer homology domain-containing protein [Clostridia bacterium]
MKKILLLLIFSLILSIHALAKTHTYDIIPPETVTYFLEENQDTLKATIYIDEDGLLGLKVRSVTSTSYFPQKISVTLKNKSNEISHFITDPEAFTEDKYYMLQGLTQGEYILEIKNETKFGDVEFVIDTFFTPWDAIEAAGASSFEKATVMELGERYKGGVMHSDESDYYTFEMPKDGYAVIDLYSSDLKFFKLYDELLNEIGTMDIRIQEENVVFETRCGLKKGKYYISVSPEEDFQNPEYALEVRAFYDADFESEYNNTHLHSTSLSLSNELRGNLFGEDDVDIYSFSLDKKSTVTATLTDMYLEKIGHYNFSILDSDANPIITRTKCNTYSFTEVLDKGDYYLSVSCPGTKYFTPFGYKVKVRAFTTSEITDTDNNKIKDDTQKEDGKFITQFDDVTKSDWFYNDVLTARKLGLIDGTGDNLFSPKGDVTIAQAVAMSARIYEKLCGTPIITGNPSSEWYTPYVLYAIEAGIINQDDFSEYNKSATRAQMAYMFARVMKNVEIPDIEVNIPDVSKDELYGKEIHTLYALGILNGNDDIGTFSPESSVTRAESAAIMLRCYSALGLES